MATNDYIDNIDVVCWLIKLFHDFEAGVVDQSIQNVVRFSCSPSGLDVSFEYVANRASIVESFLDAFGQMCFTILQNVRMSLHVGIEIQVPNTPVDGQEISSLDHVVIRKCNESVRTGDVHRGHAK